MLTVEDLGPAALARKLDTLLPRLDRATLDKLAPTFETILTVLTRPGDDEPVFVAYAVRPGQAGVPLDGRTPAPLLRVGAAFQSDGGFMLELDILPLNFDGRIVLVERKADLARLPETLRA